MLWMTLMACVASSLISCGVAALVVRRLPVALHGRLVAFAAGVMLAAALLDLLPEALTATASVESILMTVLAGLLLFHWFERHSSRHGDAVTAEGTRVHIAAGAGHAGHGRGAHPGAHPGADPERQGAARSLAWAVLVGDGLHSFVDGVLIAAAFTVSPWLGVATATAIAMHELPQEIGDLVILLSTGWTRRQAVIANTAASLASVAGGVVGWAALEHAQALTPYALALAAASLLYIAVAALMPWLNQRPHADGASNAAAMAIGVVFLPLATHWLH